MKSARVSQISIEKWHLQNDLLGHAKIHEVDDLSKAIQLIQYNSAMCTIPVVNSVKRKESGGTILLDLYLHLIETIKKYLRKELI